MQEKDFNFVIEKMKTPPQYGYIKMIYVEGKIIDVEIQERFRYNTTENRKPESR